MRLVVLHGASTSGAAYSDVVDAARARGVEAQAPDIDGHGASGRPLAGRVLEPLRRLYDADTVLLGHSFGGYLALRLAAERAPAAVVAFAPTADELVRSRFRDWDAEVDADAFDAWVAAHDGYAAAAGIACPVLYVHARDDDRIPLAHVVRLQRATPRSELVVRTSGGHSGPVHDPAVQALALDWIAATVRA